MKWSVSKKILEEIDLLLLLMIRYKMVCVKKIYFKKWMGTFATDLIIQLIINWYFIAFLFDFRLRKLKIFKIKIMKTFFLLRKFSICKTIL